MYYYVKKLKKIISWFCIVAAVSVLYQYVNPKPKSLVTSVNTEYDFIIVGAGTAGCVLASRLSESENVSVLLLEAGDQFGYISGIPIAPTLLQRGSNDWAFETESQKFSSIGLANQIQYLPRGKGLGGSGQVNYLLHGIGVPSDYENWVKMGAEGWGYSVLEKIIKKTFISTKCLSIDNISNHSASMECCKDENCHSKEPTIKLTDIDDNLDAISEVYMKAASELPSGIQLDVKTMKSTIFKGKRVSSYHAFLLPALNRNNLHIFNNAIATKVNFNELHAESVDILRTGDEIKRVFARKEIILSAGSIHTPQLLMLSGIGPESELVKFGIPIISVSERVGKNLHDHLNMPLYISIQKPITMTLDKIKSMKSLLTYLWKKEGYLSSPGIVSIGRGKDHLSLVLFAMGSADEVLLREIANYKSEIFRALFPFYEDSKKEGFIFLSSCLQPKSRGQITLRDNDATSSPKINPNYLSNDDDIKCTINGIRMAIELINTPSFKSIGAVIHWPNIQICMDMWTAEIINDNYLECIIRASALTGHHAAGTCSMAGENPVVHPSLQVLGVERLSVVDASIFPTPVSSPPNSIIVTVAERAAQIIRSRHNMTLPPT